ncbi:hypothetical protein GN244_ATG07438 [Phytophthora infestans]|uniref:Sfi1 spindle body domain-containing protein n=1 Tax=Phytophthora infestans TaxID=4787 RepID=A0A833WWL6_PHYIN|nr:hypothetical protein GN244_ATG07438 [Phytophthora infestans]
MVFTSWKQQSQAHARCRKLLVKVALGSHLRFRFMLWQRLTAHRKRLATLLFVASESPSTSLETTVENEDGITVRNALKCDSNSALNVVTLGQALAQKARVIQRFQVTWDLPQAWHRWRQIFHAQLFYRMRRQQFFFHFWQYFTYQKRKIRVVLFKMTTQRQAACSRTIFRAWAELVTRVKQLQKDRLRERELWVLVTTEMARRERRQLKKHWHAWRFHVGESRHLYSSLDVYYQARLLTKFWLLWSHDYCKVVSETRRETQRVEVAMRIFYLRRAARKLKELQTRSKRARLVLEYFRNRRYDSLLPEMLDKWRRWSERQKRVALCLEAARRNKLRRYFIFWNRWKNTRKLQSFVISSCRSKSAKLQQRDVWIRWRRYVKERVAKDVALRSAAILHMGTRLKRWLHYTQCSIQSREQAQTAITQLFFYRGHRAVRRWREFGRVRRLGRLYQRFVLRKHIQLWRFAVKCSVAIRFDEFLLRSKATKWLVAWQKVTTKHQYWRKLCESFKIRKKKGKTHQLFRQWQQFVNKEQGKRLALMHAEQRLLRVALRSWNRATVASQLRRDEQLEQAAAHEMATLFRQSFAVWQAAAKKQRERRFVLLSCVIKLQSVANHHVQQIIFQSWERVVDFRRRCEVALLKRERNIARNLLISWLRWACERQQRRQQLENAVIYHSQRLRSAVFFYWQTYALAWQDAAKPMATRHNRQMVLFAKSAAEARDISAESDSEDEVRRPTSPVMKRLRQKKANRLKILEMWRW